jgi:hypothetical protein
VIRKGLCAGLTNLYQNNGLPGGTIGSGLLDELADVTEFKPSGPEGGPELQGVAAVGLLKFGGENET